MPIDSTGLVARWYTDEAASGTTPPNLLEENGLYDVPIFYDASEYVWDEVAGNRGLQSTTTATDGRCARAVVNGDLIDSMEGGTGYTIELVLIVNAVSGSVSRIFGIHDTVGGSFDLGMYSGNISLFTAAWNHNSSNDFTIDFGSLTSRTVIHLVWDTPQASQTDRMRFYKNGVELTAGKGVGSISQGSTLIIDDGNSELIWNNRQSSGTYQRGFQGTTFYTGIYDVAMTPANITNNYNELIVDDDTPVAGSSPVVNPTGNTLGTLASGVPTIPPDDTETVLPLGTALGTLVSDTPSLQIVNPGNDISPTGDTFSTLVSDIPVIEITLLPVETDPIGDTTGTLAENSAVTIRENIVVTLQGIDGNGFFSLASGVCAFAGVGTSPVTLFVTSQGPSNVLFPVVSDVPASITITPANTTTVLPQGDTFGLLGSEADQPPLNPPLFVIETDLAVSIGNEGNTLPAVQSGVTSFLVEQTGVLGTVLGSTFGTLASSTAKFSQSHPTAPPGTAGGRLIIRSITQNITRPVTLATDVQIAIASA